MLLMFVKLQEESWWCRWTVVVVDERSRHPCAHHSRPLPTRLGGLHCNLRGGQGVAHDGVVQAWRWSPLKTREHVPT